MNNQLLHSPTSFDSYNSHGVSYDTFNFTALRIFFYKCWPCQSLKISVSGPVSGPVSYPGPIIRIYISLPVVKIYAKSYDSWKLVQI